VRLYTHRQFRNFEKRRSLNYDEFLTIDKNLPSPDDNEDCEDSIVEGIKSKLVKLVEDDDDDESPVPVTNHEVNNIWPRYNSILCRKEMKAALYPS